MERRGRGTLLQDLRTRLVALVKQRRSQGMGLVAVFLGVGGAALGEAGGLQLAPEQVPDVRAQLRLSKSRAKGIAAHIRSSGKRRQAQRDAR